MDNFFECQGKMFLSIEKDLEKISADQQSDKSFTFLYSYNLRNIVKQN